MSKEGVQRVVARMITDTAFRKAVIKNPKAAVGRSGLALTSAELAAISKIKASDLQITTRKKGVGGVASFELDVRTARF